jgi:EAL domain-containing protein (putative c-di-GMP-specific phosphodiesterase class I)
VAEGIENRADLDLLRDIGVPRGQGFLWGKPA